MSGAFVSATVNIGDVEQGLDAMERRAHALGPAFAEIKSAMKLDQREHRDDQAGPDGKWSPRAASTIAMAKQRHKRLPRRVLGKLPTAVAYKSTALGAVGESRVKWSLSQQDGGRVGRGAVLPARPFLWISDKLLAAAAEIVDRKLAEAWGGR